MAVISGAAELYLTLLKKCLINSIYQDPSTANFTYEDEPDKERPFELAARLQGLDWPSRAHTMAGLRRLDNVQRCIESVVEDGVDGDLMEAGVWRGGVTILMRGVLKALGITDRCVWVADSFAGVPPPNADRFPEDAGDPLHLDSRLAVSLETVRENFRRYDLLDEQVRFIAGWFADTLPACEVRKLAVLRLDGDLYESTMLALEHLYPRLSPRGYAIVDDYGADPRSRFAVEDYRDRHGITEPLETVDWTAVYWRKSS